MAQRVGRGASSVPVSSSTSSISSGREYREAIIDTSSRTERSPIRPPVCSIAPTSPAAMAV